MLVASAVRTSSEETTALYSPARDASASPDPRCVTATLWLRRDRGAPRRHEYSPSGSVWRDDYEQYEEDVFQTLLTHVDPDTNRSWVRTTHP